ncbi:hypothetical protein [Campylobacter fetus]|uniref:hypothetical protein n=1 Tax=Campylobacter fetus TaxID=196 RepID=UPI000FCBDB0B|nr:hypothetical protein [Campylobacter fetus]RUT51053.1 hypothetical protein BWK67_00600 [Campylobacter fetus]RUT51781.1 hypothetical protein BWK51_00600 [Campylobacter fetus]
MLFELLDEFKKRLEKNKDIVIQSRALKDGVYARISGEKCEIFYVKTTIEKIDKNRTERKTILYKQNGDIASYDDKDWFEQADYLSSLWDMNKAILINKKFHSINFLTLFFKLEESGYVRENLREYFDIFRDYNMSSNVRDKEVISFYADYIKDENRRSLITNSLVLCQKYFTDIDDFAIRNNFKKCYIKFFIDEDLKLYEKESRIYIDWKIYNSNDFNITHNNEILGLSNFNMGMNKKKPFLEHKNRAFRIPYVISQKDALVTKMLFDWLGSQNKINIRDFNSIFMSKFNKNSKAVISDFDYVPVNKSNFKFDKFKIKNFMDIENGEREILSFDDFKQVIDEQLYQRRLFGNLYNDEIRVSKLLSEDMQNLLYHTRHSMIEYFEKFNSNEFYYVIQKYSNDFIKVAMQDSEFGRLNANKAINLLLSIKETKGEKVGIDEIKNRVISALADDNITKLNGNEYYFLVGNLAMRLVSKSKGWKKTFALTESYTKARNTKKLKIILFSDFDRYKYDIFIGDEILRKAFLLAQNCEDLVMSNSDQQMVLIGMMAKNIIKKPGEKDEIRE